MSLLYQVFVYPLEVVMEWVLTASYSMVGDYGMALLFLSVIVNVAILPLYHIAEKWQWVERQAQEKLAPKLREFRQVFVGEERHMMIRTLYRQHGYHPIYALRNSLGFLIQVPFFIAAYQLLSHYQPLQGASFFLIEDLGKSDGLLWGVNFLPFFMTGINLISVLIYTQQLRLADKIQLWSIAGIFLVLLYGSPAGLVLYWTFNNLFSVFKNMVYGRFFNTASIKVKAAGEPSVSLRHRLGSLRTFISINGQGIHSPTWFKVVLFVVFFDRAIYYKSVGLSGPGATLAMIECLAILSYLCLTALQTFVASFRGIPQHYVKMCLLIFLGIASGAFVVDWVLGIHALLDADYLKRTLMASLLMVFLVSHLKLKTELNLRQHSAVFLGSMLVAGIFLFFNPLFVYTSSPESLGTITAGDIYGFLFRGLCAAFFLYVSVLVLGSLFKGWIPVLYMTGIVWAAFVAFVYGYVATVNYGIFQQGQFADEGLMFSQARFWVLPESIFLGVLFYASYRLLQSKPLLVSALFTLFILLLSKDLLVQMGVFEGSFMTPQTVSASTLSSPPDTTADIKTPLAHLDRIRFSKTGNNILFLIPDAGAGYVFSEIYKAQPSLFDNLDGFTFYPNTVATGPNTLENTPALIAGPQFAPHKINERPGHTLEEIIIQAYNGLIHQVRTQGYGLTLVNPAFVSCALLHLASDEQCFVSESQKYRSALYQRYGITDALYLEEKALYMFSLFKSLPLSLKPHLYQSPYWSLAFSPQGPSGLSRWAKEKHYFSLYLRSLPELSYVDEEDDSSQFIHLWTQDLHTPYALDKGCTPPNFGTHNPFGDNERKLASVCYLQAVSEWITWMKQEGVYNNTKIILVADHGAAGASHWHTGGVNPLMMVKEFHATESFKISSSLLYNADALSMICSGLGGCTTGEPDPTQSKVENRKLTYSVIKWEHFNARKNRTTFDIRKSYVITEDMVSSPDWRERIQG